jgi:hypothetical protein
MADDTTQLDDLLGRMPAIAEAVSAFPEAVQQSAFDALMAAATGNTAPAPAPNGGDRKVAPKKRRSGTRPQKTEPSTENGNVKARRAAGASQPKIVKELDLRPKGKASFADFVKAKNPTNNHDKHAVAIYYLSNEAGLNTVSSDDVFTAWRDEGWKLPPDFLASLRLTASKKRFLDTSNSEALRLLNTGVNRVEHDLPVPKKG